MSIPDPLRGKDRLIVALDVSSVDEALRAVERLSNVNFFKIGLQLFMTGGLPTLLEALREKQVFCLLYTSPSPRDRQKSRMPSSA